LEDRTSACRRQYSSIKPATITPGTATRITEIFEEAGIPPGVLNLIIGSGSEAGDEIINHPSQSDFFHWFQRSRDTSLRTSIETRRQGSM
jgi:delta 1-pyrroline-5-carboxylate dehydrogenase